MSINQALIKSTRKLATRCRRLRFPPPVTHVYHPLDYAAKAHEAYLNRYAATSKKVLFLGMNPGPWGMAQTGIPFGDVVSVRDFLKIETPIRAPANTHSKRPVLGFDCLRREVSGKRLWGVFEECWQDADTFFTHHFVLNYCPLLFLSEHDKGVRNITPDKIAADATQNLFRFCDDFLREVVVLLTPEKIIGIGLFAEKRLKSIFSNEIENGKLELGVIPHPSPANPASNSEYSQKATAQLRVLNIL